MSVSFVVKNNFKIIILLLIINLTSFSFKTVSSSSIIVANGNGHNGDGDSNGDQGREFVTFSSDKNLPQNLLSTLTGFGLKNLTSRRVEDGSIMMTHHHGMIRPNDGDETEDDDNYDQDEEDESWEEEEEEVNSPKKSEEKEEEEDKDDDDDDEFRREDLIDDVTELERDAQLEEQSSLLPQILGLFNHDQKGQQQEEEDHFESSSYHQNDNHHKPSTNNETIITLPEDLSELPEDIVDDIEAGVEESLLLSDDGIPTQNATETRQFSIYMFQGQYMPEARLNRFVDGAIRNMGGELRMAVMDPLYFRVLPRGRVESRQKPIGKIHRTGPIQPVESLRGNFNDGEVEGRTGRAGFLDRIKQKIGTQQKRIINKKKPKGRKRGVGGVGGLTGTRRRVKNRRRNNRRKPIRNGGGGGGGLRRRPNNKNKNKRNPNKKKNQNQNRRRKFFRRRKKKKPLANNRRPGNKNKNNNKNKPNNKNKFQQQKNNKNRRQKRRARRNVGGGRVEGLSVLQRDGDAEMQVFGNYTLIRSHMKMGPVQLQMQFRTRRGLRRTGATLPVIRMHTVTRVNMEGSEMIDFLLDRPHPESIKVRGNLFPLAQRIARNIFARLFLPNSFLVSRLREKASLALLSKPKSKK